jgi:hypothetical protein
MTLSLEGLKTEGVIGSLEFSELEKFFEFQRLRIPTSPRCGQPLISLIPSARPSPSVQWNDVFRLWMTTQFNLIWSLNIEVVWLLKVLVLWNSMPLIDDHITEIIANDPKLIVSQETRKKMHSLIEYFPSVCCVDAICSIFPIFSLRTTRTHRWWVFFRSLEL